MGGGTLACSNEDTGNFSTRWPETVVSEACATAGTLSAGADEIGFASAPYPGCWVDDIGKDDTAGADTFADVNSAG